VYYAPGFGVNQAEKQAYAEVCLKRLAKLLPYLYDLDRSYEPSKKNAGACSTEPEYFRSHINLDLAGMKDQRTIARHVCHEFSHIPHWPVFDIAQRLATGKFEKTQVKLANESSTTAWEIILFRLAFPELSEAHAPDAE